MKKVLLLLTMMANIYSSEPFTNNFVFVFTPVKRAKINLAVKTLVNIFEKADRQGRAAAYNLLRLPLRLQCLVLDNLTSEERADLAQVSPPHEKLIKDYNKKQELIWLQPLAVDDIQRLGKALPTIKKLVVGGVIYDKDLIKAITDVFPELEVIEMVGCDFLMCNVVRILLFDEWIKAKPGREVTCRPRGQRFNSILGSFPLSFYSKKKDGF